MSYLINNQQKMNDIIFAGRNKSYGAYAIRSTYGNTLLRSILFMIAGAGSIMLAAYCLASKAEVTDLGGQVIPNVKIYENIPVDLTPKENKPAEKSAAAAPGKPSNSQPQTQGAITVVDSVAVASPSPEATGTPSAASTETSSGTGTVATTNTGNTKGDETKKGGKEVKQLYGVDTQPEFEGGMAALYRFIGSHIKYPDIAQSEGREGVVYVKFVVDENGQVGSLSLERKEILGYGLDEEAMRVVGLLPKFKKPATLDGEPVKVYYLLPIRFKLR